MKEIWFEKHPLFTALGLIVTVNILFSFLGFEEKQLMITTFSLAFIIMTVYFDKRIEKLEKEVYKNE